MTDLLTTPALRWLRWHMAYGKTADDEGARRVITGENGS